MSNCGNCSFWWSRSLGAKEREALERSGLDPDVGSCRRDPAAIATRADHWCASHKLAYRMPPMEG